MRFYLAVEKEEKPFVYWAEVASSLDEYIELGFDANPLVLPAELVPSPIYGVCPKKIVDGEIVDCTSGEMETYHEEWEIAEAMKANFNRLPEINADNFLYDGKSFPMDEVSRLFYHAIDKIRGNQKIMTTSNELYNLIDAATNIDDFLLAYHTKLLLITKHDI